MFWPKVHMYGTFQDVQYLQNSETVIKLMHTSIIIALSFCFILVFNSTILTIRICLHLLHPDTYFILTPPASYFYFDTLPPFQVWNHQIVPLLPPFIHNPWRSYHPTRNFHMTGRKVCPGQFIILWEVSLFPAPHLEPLKVVHTHQSTK